MAVAAGRDGRRFHLSIPGAADHLATARLFVATTARALGLDEDAVADLKLAVSEAASAAIGAEVISIEVRDEVGGLSVWVGPVDPSDLTADHIHPRDVIDALYPGSSFRDGGLVIEVGAQSPSPQSPST